MPRAAEEAHRRAFENLAIDQRVEMRARSRRAPDAKPPGIWQAILKALERTDDAKQIAEDAKATADKASRPARAAAEKLIRDRSV